MIPVVKSARGGRWQKWKWDGVRRVSASLSVALVAADIIYIRCGLAKPVREVSEREKENATNEASGTFEFLS